MRKLSPLLVLVVAAAAGACEPEKPTVPTMPSFVLDVQPILAEHCVRCHGEGGTLQGDPGDPLGEPTTCYFNLYDDDGDCSTDPANCKTGTKTCATIWEGYFPLMPPAPAAKLNEWELAVLRAWAKNPIP